MNCRRIEPLLSRHLDGSLSKPDAEAVLVHVADCPACRRLRDRFLAIGHRLREPVAVHLAADVDQRAIEQWLAERVSAPPNARRRFLAPFTPWRSTRPILWGLAAAGVFAAALFAARWEHSRTVGSYTPLARAVIPHALMPPSSESQGGRLLLMRKPKSAKRT